MSTDATHPAAGDRIEPWVWKICGIVIVGSIMSILDTTIVNVALDTLARELHTTIAEIQWVVTGYLLSLAAVIPVSGWLSRRFGLSGLPRGERQDAGRLDVLGLVLLVTGMPLITYGLAEIGQTGGFSSPKVLVPILGGLALVAAFIAHALRAKRPLLDVHL